jgi:Schitoviridae virion DNA-directed RNA polymerase
VWAERNWQAAMAAVRTNIVVRSMAVPLTNFVSGITQLNMRGIPLLKSLRAVPSKVLELEFYSKTMTEKIELEAERFASEGDVVKTRRIDARLTALGDSLKRLSIWPLIEAGEFSTISDVGQTAESLGTGDDTLVEKLSRAVGELPPGLRDLARQGYMARDTALFRLMQKSTQYSDFIMKAIYFDHLVAGGRSRGAALAEITEEFNNYDVLPGRDRGYAESVGLAWFLNYKIRSMKVAINMVRKNPLNLLMYAALPHPLDVGGPLTDNLGSSILELSVGRSLGPGMATNPIALNPWYNLVSD